MKFEFDFDGYVCTTFFIIEYENQRRIKKNTRKGLLDKLSVNLLKRVFEKMDQKSFVKMRRSNKRMSGFIQKYRDALRIPLFYSCRIMFNRSKEDADDAEVSFQCPSPNGEFYAEDYGSLEGFEKTDFEKFTGMIKREIHVDFVDADEIFGLPLVTISLKKWKNSLDLQKELMGVYNGFKITIGPFQTVKEMELVFEFIKFAALEGKELNVTRVSDNCLQMLCKNAEPIKLEDSYSLRSKNIFMQNGFQALKQLFIEEYPVVPKFSHLPNLEKIYIRLNLLSEEENDSNYDADSYEEIVKTVNKWKNGEMPLKEMLFHGYDTAINIGDFNGTIYPEDEMDEIFDEFRIDPPDRPRSPDMVTCTSARRTLKFTFDPSIGMPIECRIPIESCVVRCEPKNKTAIITCGESYDGPYAVYFAEKSFRFTKSEFPFRFF